MVRGREGMRLGSWLFRQPQSPKGTLGDIYYIYTPGDCTLVFIGCAAGIQLVCIRLYTLYSNCIGGYAGHFSSPASPGYETPSGRTSFFSLTPVPTETITSFPSFTIPSQALAISDQL